MNVSDYLRNSDSQKIIGLTLLFFVLSIIGILHHEMWRDELENWLLARDSNSIGDLLVNMNTAGHPVLWYLIVYLLQGLWNDPLVMQLFNVATSCTAFYLMIRFAPFPLIQKVLFGFSYLFFFEFTVLSRSYSIELLCLIIFCILLGRNKSNPLLLGGVLFIMALTNLYGAIIAGSLAILLLADAYFYKQYSFGVKSKVLILTLVIITAGVLLAAYDVYRQTVVEEMTDLQPDVGFKWFADNISVFFHAFVPLPNITTEYFWNSNILMALGDHHRMGYGIFLSVIVIAGSTIILSRNKAILLTYVVGATVMWILIAFFRHGELRHHLHLFLIFFACYWISLIGREGHNRTVEKNRDSDSKGPIELLISNRQSIITCLLMFQVLASAYVFGNDLIKPFSNSKMLGNYLASPKFKEHQIIGYMDYSVAPSSVFHGKQMYFPQSDRFGTFMRWDDSRDFNLTHSTLISAIDSIAQTGKHKWLFVANQLNNFPLCDKVGETFQLPSGSRLKYLIHFEGGIVENENYYVYLLL